MSDEGAHLPLVGHIRGERLRDADLAPDRGHDRVRAAVPVVDRDGEALAVEAARGSCQ